MKGSIENYSMIQLLCDESLMYYMSMYYINEGSICNNVKKICSKANYQVTEGICDRSSNNFTKLCYIHKAILLARYNTLPDYYYRKGMI